MTSSNGLVSLSLTAAFATASIAFAQPAIAQTDPPVTAAPVPSPNSATRGCPDVTSIKSADGSDYAVVFQSSEPVTATIALHLYAGDHDYLATLPTVAFPVGKTFGDRTVYQSKPIHLRKPPGQNVFAASIDSTLQSPTTALCGVKNIDVAAPETSPPVDTVVPRSDETGEAIDLTPTDPTHFTCTNPFANAAVTHAERPLYPRVNADGVVRIKVTIASDGSITGATVYKSSGNTALDASALDAATASTYSPGRNDCKPIAGSYLFTAEFRR